MLSMKQITMLIIIFVAIGSINFYVGMQYQKSVEGYVEGEPDERIRINYDIGGEEFTLDDMTFVEAYQKEYFILNESKLEHIAKEKVGELITSNFEVKWDNSISYPFFSNEWYVVDEDIGYTVQNSTHVHSTYSDYYSAYTIASMLNSGEIES